MAKNRSLDKAVNVNTDTPIDTSFTNSDIVQMVLPHGHDSNVYTSDTNGTDVTMTSKSASANDRMYLKDKIKQTVKVGNSMRFEDLKPQCNHNSHGIMGRLKLCGKRGLFDEIKIATCARPHLLRLCRNCNVFGIHALHTSMK